MKEFDAFEIERSGRPEEDVKLGFCPMLKGNCHGELCMWWVRDWNEQGNRFQSGCAVNLIAVGMNDENLRRLGKQEP